MITYLNTKIAVGVFIKGVIIPKESEILLNVLIPMAGRGLRFKRAGYTEPKPMIKIGNRTMIDWALHSLKNMSVAHEFFFVALESDLSYGLNEILFNKGKVISLKQVTSGAVNSTLYASQFIDNKLPLMIMNCDQFLNWSINDFLLSIREFDASVVVFKSQNPHHSYIEYESKNVSRIEEKNVISDLACGGIYYFKHGSDYVRAANLLLDDRITVNGEYYISPTLNKLIQTGKKITFFEVEMDKIFMLGTPEELIYSESKMINIEE